MRFRALVSFTMQGTLAVVAIGGYYALIVIGPCHMHFRALVVLPGVCRRIAIDGYNALIYSNRSASHPFPGSGCVLPGVCRCDNWYVPVNCSGLRIMLQYS